jgi:hypothetical protein
LIFYAIEIYETIKRIKTNWLALYKGLKWSFFSSLSSYQCSLAIQNESSHLDAIGLSTHMTLLETTVFRCYCETLKGVNSCVASLIYLSFDQNWALTWSHKLNSRAWPKCSCHCNRSRSKILKIGWFNISWSFHTTMHDFWLSYHVNFFLAFH